MPLRRNFNKQVKITKKYPNFFLQGGFIEKPHRTKLKEIQNSFNTIKPKNVFENAPVWSEMQLNLRNLNLCVESYDNLMLTVFFLKDEAKKKKLNALKDEINKNSLKILDEIHMIFLNAEKKKNEYAEKMQIDEWSEYVHTIRKMTKQKCDEYRQNVMKKFRKSVIEAANVASNDNDDEDFYKKFENDWNRITGRPTSP